MLALTLQMLVLLPLGISILALIYNYNTKVICGRKSFVAIFAATSIVPLIFLYSDLSMLLGWPAFPTHLHISVLYLSLAALAYPLYQRVCQRIFDTGLSKHIALISLLPFLNLFLFFFLCLKPSITERAKKRLGARDDQ